MVEQKITEIKKSIVEYSVLVESMIDKTIKGLLKKDKTMLETVMKIDEPTANNREVEIEENCIVVIAEESPKAKDLRTILMAIKMNNDLERIADMAVNILSLIHI